MARDLADTMKAIYDSKLNCGVKTQTGDKCEAWVGNDADGRRAVEDGLEFVEVADWMHTMVLHYYPISAYAKAAASA